MERPSAARGTGSAASRRSSGRRRSRWCSKCLDGRVAPGSKLTHDGASCHNKAVAELSLEDDWVKFVAGDEEYEGKMKPMGNCCSYLRHCFESHQGIRFSKLAAYANLFLHRWSHVRRHGLKDAIDYLFNRVRGTKKSHFFREPFEKRRCNGAFLSIICWYI